MAPVVEPLPNKHEALSFAKNNSNFKEDSKETILKLVWARDGMLVRFLLL
jgi:hypothetical protein